MHCGESHKTVTLKGVTGHWGLYMSLPYREEQTCPTQLGKKCIVYRQEPMWMKAVWEQPSSWYTSAYQRKSPSLMSISLYFMLGSWSPTIFIVALGQHGEQPPRGQLALNYFVSYLNVLCGDSGTMVSRDAESNHPAKDLEGWKGYPTYLRVCLCLG